VRAAALRTRALCGNDSDAEREIGHRLAAESLALCRGANDGRGAGESLFVLSCVSHMQGRSAEARATLDGAVALARTLGDEPLLCLLLASYGGMSMSDKDEKLEAPLEEGRELAERLGDTFCVEMACRGLAGIARARGDTARAMALYREELTCARALGSTVSIWMALTNLGRAHLTLGEVDQARTMLREALALMRAAHFRGSPFHVIAVEALAAAEAGERPRRAVRLLGAAEALRTRHWASGEARPERDEGLRGALRGRLGPVAFAAAWEEGLAMTVDRVVDYALSDAAADRIAEAAHGASHPSGWD
jgi:ATP/maltotriose-dependent transcriptional regulator MalT